MSQQTSLPPSSAARRVKCPGSRAMEQHYRPGLERSQKRLEGNAAHWVASQMLYGLYDNESKDYHGEQITDEMKDGAMLYSNYVLSIVRSVNNRSALFQIEHEVDISSIHPACNGKVDSWFYADGHLHVFEYKYGHRTVDVFENWQMLEYAAGIIDYLRTSRPDENCSHITFSIIQPRSFHRDGNIRTWTIDRSQAETYFSFLRYMEQETFSENAPCIPNPECTNCLARFACEALQRSALQAVDMVTTPVPFELTPEQTGSELRLLMRAAKMLDARINGLTEQAIYMIKSGKRVSHYSLEPSFGRKRWNIPDDEVYSIGEFYNADLRKIEPVSPKRATESGVPDFIVKQYTETPNTGMKLVELQADRIFKK